MDRGSGGKEEEERLKERREEMGMKGWRRWKQTGRIESVTCAGDKTA